MAACAVIPAALALACNPQAYLTVGSQYAPGDSVRVSGSFFKSDTNITVSIDRTGQSATLRTSANGAFQATFALPANAPSGGYSVQAIGFEANGDVIAGLPARGSFSVAAASAAPAPAAATAPAPQPSVQSSAPAPSPTATAAPAARPAPRPTASAPPVSGFREPTVVREPTVQSSSPAPARTPSREAATRSGRATAPSTDTATVNGRAVFGGSVAPAVGTSAVSVPAPAVSVPAPAVAATTGSSRATRSSGQPAGAKSTASPRATSPVAVQAATDDVWGSVSSGRSPSLSSATGDGASVSSQPAGSQLALGLLLLGIGGVLVGGLAVADTRRRVRAR